MLASSKTICPFVSAAAVFLLIATNNLSYADDSFQAAPAAPANVAAAAPAAPPKAILLARTPLRLVLEQSLKSGGSKVGDLVEYHVANDIYTADRQLVVLAGTRAYGRVLVSKNHSYVGIPGKLEIGVNYILTPDKTKIPLRATQPGGKGQDELPGTIAATIIVGIPGLFISGESKSLPKGTEVNAYIAADTPLIPYVTLTDQKAPPFDPLGPVENQYILNDGTQVVGYQTAFDGTKYSVTTDSGIQLLDVGNVKAINHVTGPAAPVVR